VVSIYSNDFPCSYIFSLGAELRLRRCQWKVKNHRPDIVIDTLPHCTNVLPNIQILLRLFATLPITSATPERTFIDIETFKIIFKVNRDQRTS